MDFKVQRCVAAKAGPLARVDSLEKTPASHCAESALRECGGISPELFTRWLALFDESCRAVLPAGVAEAMQGRAVQIADSLKAGMFFRPSQV